MWKAEGGVGSGKGQGAAVGVPKECGHGPEGRAAGAPVLACLFSYVWLHGVSVTAASFGLSDTRLHGGSKSTWAPRWF